MAPKATVISSCGPSDAGAGTERRSSSRTESARTL